MALLNTLLDNFDTGSSFDSSKWTFDNLGLSGLVSQTGGKLHFDCDTTTVFRGECHLHSLNNYDLTGNGAYVKLISRSDVNRTYVGFRVYRSADPNDWAEIYINENGVLSFLATNNGTFISGSTATFNATTHAWWRIRELGGTVYFDTAPSTASNPPVSGDWTNRFSDTITHIGWSGGITSVKATLYQRLVASGATTPPTAEFDGFNTSAGTGLSAAFTVTELASDVLASTVAVKIAAAFGALTEVGSDTFAAAAVTASTIINATFAVTGSGVDTFVGVASTGTVRTGTFTAVESNTPDTLSALASVGNFLPPYQPPTATVDFIAWLKKSDSAKCLLVEIDVLDSSGTQSTIYLSSIGYVTGPTELPPNTIYKSEIIGGCTMESEISLSYTTDMTLGDVEVSNINGIHDDWFSYIWRNRPVRFYLGDARWKRNDFRLVFSGNCHDIASRERNKINLVLSDKLQRLNQSVTSHVLGGNTDNKDKLIPLCFGEVSNITPLLIDPTTLTYQVHDGAILDIIDVRDEGYPINTNVVKDLANGKFTLTVQPAGRVTCTVQGDNFSGMYASSLAQIVRRLVSGYGTQPFTSLDVNQTSFAAFEALHPQKMGVYLQDRENILDICNLLASSIAAALTVDSDGKLRLNRLEISGDSITYVMNESNFTAKSFEIVDRLDIQPTIKLGFCRNWTPQPNLQSGIPPEHKALWADEWMTVTLSDTATCALYSIPTQPADTTDTYLITSFDALGEAFHRLALFGVPRVIYGYTAFPELILTEIGEWHTVTHDRFGFDAGKDVFILGVAKDWLNCKVNIKALR